MTLEIRTTEPAPLQIKFRTTFRVGVETTNELNRLKEACKEIPGFGNSMSKNALVSFGLYMLFYLEEAALKDACTSTPWNPPTSISPYYMPIKFQTDKVQPLVLKAQQACSQTTGITASRLAIVGIHYLSNLLDEGVEVFEKTIKKIIREQFYNGDNLY